MDFFQELPTWLLIAMPALVLVSAFFSASEAALFFLSTQDRRNLAEGNRAQRLAAKLLSDPDRLLTAILFWNLLVNITYFSLASIGSIQLDEQGMAGAAGLFAVVSLLCIMFLSEMLPKSIGLLLSRRLASWLSFPLSVAVRAIDPLLGIFRWTNLLSQRLIWPHFKPEPYLEVVDLERAVELSTTDATLLEQERTVLQNIVSLSQIRADELMRPRVQFLSFHPPVSIKDLEGRQPPSGYVLITETDSDEITGAVPIKTLSAVPSEHLEHHAQPVIYVPWCSRVGEALEQMRSHDRTISAVVNEYGDTIGILTLDDILDTIFTYGISRSERILHQTPIQPAGKGIWRVTGMTTRRRLAREFSVPVPTSKSVTVAGIVQEALGRLPVEGDCCQWGPFNFEVAEVPDRGQLVLLMRLQNQPQEETS